MNIDELLRTDEEVLLLENKNFIISTLNKLKSMTWDKAQDFLRGKVKEFFNKLDSSGVDRKKIISIANKHMWSNVNSPAQLTAKKIVESRLDEGIFGDWWKEATGNIYGALSFYPLLTAFLEMDKVIKQSGDADVRAMGIYFLIWLGIITGKIVNGRLVSSSKKAPKVDEIEDDKHKVKASLHPAQR